MSAANVWSVQITRSARKAIHVIALARARAVAIVQFLFISTLPRPKAIELHALCLPVYKKSHNDSLPRSIQDYIVHPIHQLHSCMIQAQVRNGPKSPTCAMPTLLDRTIHWE